MSLDTINMGTSFHICYLNTHRIRDTKRGKSKEDVDKRNYNIILLQCYSLKFTDGKKERNKMGYNLH